MKRLILKLMFFTCCFLSIKSYGQDMEKHQWKNRVLIVKTSDIKSNNYEKQLKELQNHNKDFKERKLIIYKIQKDQFSSINYSIKTKSSGQVSKQIKEKIFKENEDFEVILIGLDGTIKLRKNEILTAEKLFSIIDSMQMRKNELKN